MERPSRKYMLHLLDSGSPERTESTARHGFRQRTGVPAMELEGGLSRDEAERQAWACLRVMDSPGYTEEIAA